MNTNNSAVEGWVIILRRDTVAVENFVKEMKKNKSSGTLNNVRPKLQTRQIKEEPESEYKESVNLTRMDAADRDKDGTFMIVNTTYGPNLSKDRNDLRFGYYRSTSNDLRKKRKRILTVETDQMNYSATNTNAEDTLNAASINYYVGIYDRTTKKMKLVDAEYFELHPVRKDDQIIDDIKLKTKEDDMTYGEKSDRLVKEFGSAKGKRLVNARQRNEVKGEALEQAMGSVISEASVNIKTELSELKVDEDSSDIMPLCHHDASCIEECYLLSDFISGGEMVALREVSAVFSEVTKDQVNDWRNKQIYPGHILDQLQYMSPNAEQRQSRACSLLYLYYMIQLYDTKPQQIRRANPLPMTIPEVIRNKLLNKFTATVLDKSGRSIRCMPKRLKDSLTLHILVLCLIIDGFHSDCTALKKDLQLVDSRLKTFVSSLGGRVKVENSTNTESVKYFMMLPWPLNFSPAKVHVKRVRR